jgi:hypothetical protein
VGYYEARVEDSAFVVREERQQSALVRLLELARDELGYDLSDRGLTSLAGFLRLFGYDVVYEDGDIVGLQFEGQYFLETDEVFRALVPYVEPGSWVLMHSGTGQRWRYVFDGTGLRQIDEELRPWYGS